MARVTLTPKAREDLRAIGRYIARRSGSRAIADQFLDTMHEKCHLYATQPTMAQSCDEYGVPGLRGFPVRDYVVFYLPVQNGIEIYRVLHGAQNLRDLL